MSIQVVGSRLYVVGNTYSIKDRLKSIGCHWDADRKQWWIGKAKEAQLSAIVSTVAAQTTATGYVKPTPEQLAAKPCTGKAEYKGRTYYVVGYSERTGKLHLTVLDCSIEFWAAIADCKIVKRYEGRENYRTGRTEHQTVGGIRRFIERQKNEADAGGKPDEDTYLRDGEWLTKGCAECSRRGTMCASCHHDVYDY
jgi:hypothetical protein